MARPASLFLFIISGYALMYNRENEISLKKYYFKRFKGLYIPFYIAWTLMTMLYLFVNNGLATKLIPPYKMIYTLLGIDGLLFQMYPNFYIVGEWFMSCIVICYAVYPLLAWLLKRVKYITLVAFIVISVVMMFFYNPFEKINVVMNPLFVMVYFYIGMFLHETIGEKEITKPVKIGCLVVTIVCWGYNLISGYMPQIFPRLPGEWAEVVFAIWALAMIIGLRDVQLNPEKRLYSVVAYISKISWCIILVHHAIIGLYFSRRDISDYTGKELFLAFLMFALLSWFGAELVMRITSKVNGFLFPKKADAK
jgi:peptidoglycan/LPS O-acetylase OafA/YrhL